MHFTPSATERRGSNRFPIEREVRYRVLNKKSSQEAGAGTTVNMSSRGLLFTTSQVLHPGRTIEVTISWPAQLNESCPLKLVTKGRIVRFEMGRAAVEIQSHEFRTAVVKS